MDADERRRWNIPEPLYNGTAEPFEDLHPPHGTRWVKDGNGRGYWPDCCDRHRPPEKRTAAEPPTSRHAAKSHADAAPLQEPPDADAPMRALLAELLRLLRVTR